MDKKYTKFFYLRQPNANVNDRGDPIACIASQVTQSILDNNYEIKYAISTCSTKDDFNKSIARNIAFGRLQMGDPVCMTHRRALTEFRTLVVDGRPTAISVLTVILSDVSHRIVIASRVRKAAKMWLNDRVQLDESVHNFQVRLSTVKALALVAKVVRRKMILR